MPDDTRRLALAERVAGVAANIGIETALIGAGALAVHNYVRATKDLDLGSYVSLTALQGLQQRMQENGLKTELRTPDDDDPLDGVLAVWEHEDEDGDPIDAIEIVNFSRRVAPAAAALRDARPIGPSSTLRCVQLADLIALKLSAGSFRDKADVVEVLVRNPDADLDAVRAVCKQYALDTVLEPLIAEAVAER